MPDRSVMLVEHAAHRSVGIKRLRFDVERRGVGLKLRYEVHGDLEQLKMPDPETGVRRDELWTQTCFELFAREQTGTAYIEYNFSPGGDWAAYAFDGYRDGQKDIACAPPKIETDSSSDLLAITVELPHLPPAFASIPLHLSPTAILETKTGARSYWALDHLSEAPDFHRIETFKLHLD